MLRKQEPRLWEKSGYTCVFRSWSARAEKVPGGAALVWGSGPQWVLTRLLEPGIGRTASVHAEAETTHGRRVGGPIAGRGVELGALWGRHRPSPWGSVSVAQPGARGTPCSPGLPRRARRGAGVQVSSGRQVPRPGSDTNRP